MGRTMLTVIKARILVSRQRHHNRYAPAPRPPAEL